MDWKKKRFTSQEIGVICATCGDEIKINNRYSSSVFQLDKYNELWFHCPNCNHEYDIPYSTKE